MSSVWVSASSYFRGHICALLTVVSNLVEQLTAQAPLLARNILA
jgi:hypothetical protein